MQYLSFVHNLRSHVLVAKAVRDWDRESTIDSFSSKCSCLYIPEEITISLDNLAVQFEFLVYFYNMREILVLSSALQLTWTRHDNQFLHFLRAALMIPKWIKHLYTAYTFVGI